MKKQAACLVFITKKSFCFVDKLSTQSLSKLVKQFQPNYKPPDRKEVTGILLDKIYEEKKDKCCSVLKNQTVALDLYFQKKIHSISFVKFIKRSFGAKHVGTFFS